MGWTDTDQCSPTVTHQGNCLTGAWGQVLVTAMVKVAATDMMHMAEVTAAKTAMALVVTTVRAKVQITMAHVTVEVEVKAAHIHVAPRAEGGG